MVSIKSISIIFLALLTSACESDNNISAEKAYMRLNDANVIFLDVRTREEFLRDGRIQNSVLIPLDKLKDSHNKIEKYIDKEIFVYCRSGRRSEIATRYLNEQGFRAYNLIGGFLAWEKTLSQIN